MMRCLDRISIAQNPSQLETMGGGMTKDKLVEKIKELLKTDIDLDFLLILKKRDLERPVAYIRDRVDQVGA